jgi:aldehyde dehydrogenase (NAD+)
LLERLTSGVKIAGNLSRREIVKTYQLFINGQYVDPANNEWFESIDPYRGEPWAKIPRGSKADADKAVKAANEAMWRGP